MLEEARDAADGATRAGGAAEGVESPAALPPKLGTRARVVCLRVGQMLKLVRQNRAGRGLGNGHRLAAVAALVGEWHTRADGDLRAKQLEQLDMSVITPIGRIRCGFNHTLGGF